jgi:phosphopantothenoylcysteine decarboxylase/phosphopantothenate--cysteine ligase
MAGEAGDTSAVLAGRRVVLGVTGGIAAYKAVELCRRLVDAGCHVIPVLSEDARRFVGEVTFSALASERVRSSLWEDSDPIPHTHLGQTADLVLVAPATARLIARYAHGLADDLLTATLLATRAEVVLAPAMHTEMWEHPAVQDNLATLRRRGVRVVEPDVGHLAGGDVGAGRLAEPDAVLAVAADALGAVGGDMDGIRVLISAGGTREPIDPVRYIGNRSSGKQGHALADEAARRGARVTLVTTAAPPVGAAVDVVPVETAAEMETALLDRSDEADVLVMAAAVADFRPKSVADDKLSKSDGVPEIVLEPTSDILATLGRRRRPGQTLVGFAAETRDVAARAAVKLADKGIDLIVANDVSAPGVGFEHDTNAVVIIADDGSEHEVGLTDKQTVARAVLDAVVARRARRSP